MATSNDKGAGNRPLVLSSIATFDEFRSPGFDTENAEWRVSRGDITLFSGLLSDCLTFCETRED